MSRVESTHVGGVQMSRVNLELKKKRTSPVTYGYVKKTLQFYSCKVFVCRCLPPLSKSDFSARLRLFRSDKTGSEGGVSEGRSEGAGNSPLPDAGCGDVLFKAELSGHGGVVGRPALAEC